MWKVIPEDQESKSKPRYRTLNIFFQLEYFLISLWEMASRYNNTYSNAYVPNTKQYQFDII